MSLLTCFRESRELLGLEPGASPEAVKKAYRRATGNHPPDRDPEGFKAIRRAYETLSEPVRAASELLGHPVPFVDPPGPPPAAGRAKRGDTAVAVLRLASQQFSASALLGERGGAGRDRRAEGGDVEHDDGSE